MAGFSEKSYHVFNRNRMMQKRLHKADFTSLAIGDLPRLDDNIKSNSKHRRAIQRIFEANKTLQDSKNHTIVPDFQTILVRNMLG